MDEVTLLADLLERYSPTGSENTAVEYLVNAMRNLGFQAHIDRTGNAVGVLGEGPRDLVLLGHIDTVPGQIPVRIEGDLLYGRGAVDAKGPLACFVSAATKTGALPGWRIVVIGALAEEGDSHGARGILEEYRPQAAIIGEPSGWDHITLGYKGSAWFDYQVSKSMEHTAAKAESACEAAIAFWNRLTSHAAAYNAGKEKIFEQVSPSLREMSSNREDFSETAWLAFNVRLPLEFAPQALLDQLLDLAPPGHLSMQDGIPAYRADKNSPLVRAFLSAIRSTGGTPGFSVKTGTADLNIVAPVWGCPAVAYGPGDSALDHTPHEHIRISEYRASVQVLAEVLRILQSTTG